MTTSHNLSTLEEKGRRGCISGVLTAVARAEVGASNGHKSIKGPKR